MKKRGVKISCGILAVLAVVYFCLPVYMQEALIHWFPDISDTYIFPSERVEATDSCWDFPLATSYNTYRMTETENDFMQKYGTVSYLVIRNDSVLYEEYRDGWTPQTLSNIFSATKSIVGLLTGIAQDEGYLHIDDPIGNYLPEFQSGAKKKITIRHLLTMSSGLNWDESYSSLKSKTTAAYYGDDIRSLVMDLEPIEEPGKRYSYKSGDTQLLSFVVEAALQKGGNPMTISQYAEEKLWQPIQACNDALWNLDREGGDEKTYCCFNTTARDLAHLARLILHRGNWNGQQVISAAYLSEAISPASYLENEFGDGPLDYYGFQIWIVHYKGMSFPAFRGLGGQYVFALPQANAIVVRLGHKRSDEYLRENTTDIFPYLDIAFNILGYPWSEAQ